MKIEWGKLARRGAMAAIIACCVVGLTGCGGDDGDDADVVGSWMIWPVSGAESDNGEKDPIVFNANGSIDMPGDDEFISGSYSVSGNSITIEWTSQDEDETWKVKLEGNVDGDSMSGTWTDDSGSGDWAASRD